MCEREKVRASADTMMIKDSISVKWKMIFPSSVITSEKKEGMEIVESTLCGKPWISMRVGMQKRKERGRGIVCRSIMPTTVNNHDPYPDQLSIMDGLGMQRAGIQSGRSILFHSKLWSVGWGTNNRWNSYPSTQSHFLAPAVFFKTRVVYGHVLGSWRVRSPEARGVV